MECFEVVGVHFPSLVDFASEVVRSRLFFSGFSLLGSLFLLFQEYFVGHPSLDYQQGCRDEALLE